MGTTAPLPTNQARTVIGPLSTTFTPPPSCTLGYTRGANTGQAFLAQRCATQFFTVGPGQYSYTSTLPSGQVIEDITSCWPPAASEPTLAGPTFSGRGFYSPGTICPSGYSPACSATGGGVWDWPVQFSIYNGETARGCCPSGYTCAQSQYPGAVNAQTCVSVATSGNSYPVVNCTLGTLNNSTEITLPATWTSTIISAFTEGGSVTNFSTTDEYTYTTYTHFAPMIEVRWQTSDLQSPATSTSTITTSSSSGLSTTITAAAPPGSSGLSTGAKVAIGVSIPVGIIVMLLAAFLLWRRRKRQNRGGAHVNEKPVEPSESQQPPYETDGRPRYLSEMTGARETGELAAKEPVAEVADQRRYELSGEGRPGELRGITS